MSSFYVFVSSSCFAKRSRGWIALLFAFLSVSKTGAEITWHFVPGSTHDIEVFQREPGNQKKDEISFLTTGSDPYFSGKLTGTAVAADQILEFEYFSTTGVENVSVIIGPPINENARFDLPPIAIAEGWQTYTAQLPAQITAKIPQSKNVMRFDFGFESDVRVSIRNVVIRPQNEKEIAAAEVAEERNAAKRAHATAIREYLLENRDDARKPLAISSVVVNKDHILITLEGPDDASLKQVALSEYRPHHDINSRGLPFDLVNGGQILSPTDSPPTKRVYRITRKDGEIDRLHSAWRIQSGTDRLDPRRYPTRIIPSNSNHAQSRLVPKNQKGLTCLSHRGPRNDFVDLGVHSATINVVLGAFLRDADGPDRVRIPAPGAPVYFNHSTFNHYDPLVEFARKHDIVVSATVLIRSSKRGSPRSPLVHPECDGGTYAMPDLTSERGVAVYTYVLNEIARRYRNHEQAPGGITNWIAHNEIDFHTVWTNMGRQPRELVTETYYRTLRLIHNVAREHNPHARVFASLTHNWNVPDDGRWQRLSPREFLKKLQRYATLEGEFEWGVAYHPYPESLFAKVAWNDINVSDDFDTPLITIQNLQVLGRFLEQSTMRHAGSNEARPVLLSEQGFHSDTYTDEAQLRHAGSLLWTMRRVRSMPWIESFIYHRWIDHPVEGGLKLGLRTLPDKEHPYGKRKRAWHVYQAIGTDQEATVTKGLPRP